MFKFGKKDKNESIGLDIGSYSIKVVSIEKGQKERLLTSYNIKRLPLEAKHLKRSNLIKETLKEIGLKPRKVNLSISGPEVVVRFVTLPQMKKEQLEDALKFEAEKYIPFNINEVFLDSVILGEAPGSGQMRVLLAAAKRKSVEELIETVEELGMKVNVMDIDPFTVFNTFTAFNRLEKDSVSAFLNMGHSRTDILVSIGDSPYLTRQVQIGGRDVTDLICKNMSVSSETGESYKMGIGEYDKEMVRQSALQILDTLVNEIRLSLSYFENRFNKEIASIYCSGGAVYQEGLVEYLDEKLSASVKKWSPAKGIKLSENLSREDIDSVALELVVSIGLALRG